MQGAVASAESLFLQEQRVIEQGKRVEDVKVGLVMLADVEIGRWEHSPSSTRSTRPSSASLVAA